MRAFFSVVFLRFLWILQVWRGCFRGVLEDAVVLGEVSGNAVVLGRVPGNRGPERWRGALFSLRRASCGLPGLMSEMRIVLAMSGEGGAASPVRRGTPIRRGTRFVEEREEKPDRNTALSVGLTLVMTLYAFDQLGTVSVMPAVSEELDGQSLYGATLSAFLLASIVTLTLAGDAADRWGLGRSFLLALVLFAVGLMISAFAPTMLLLVVGRGVQGFGGGALSTITFLTVHLGYEEKQRAGMLATLSAAWVLPGLLGPPIAGYMADVFSWRWVFVGIFLLIPFVAVLTFPSLKNLGTKGGDRSPAGNRAEARDQADQGAQATPQPFFQDSRVWRALLAALGMGVFLFGLSRVLPVVPAVLCAGIGLSVGCRAVAGLLPPGTFLFRPVLPVCSMLRFLLAFAFFGTDAFVSLALHEIHDVSLTTASMVYTVAAVTWALGSRLQARIDRPILLAEIGALLITVGIGILMLVPGLSASFVIAIAAWAVAGLGMGFAHNAVTLTAMSATVDGKESQTSASLGLADALGVGLGSGIGGAMLGAGEDFGWALSSALLLVWGVMLLVGLVSWGGTVRLRRFMGKDAPVFAKDSIE